MDTVQSFLKESRMFLNSKISSSNSCYYNMQCLNIDLQRMCKNRCSSSSIIVSPNGYGALPFVTNFFMKYEQVKYKVAVIDGNEMDNDNQALISLANQLMEKGNRSNYVLNVDLIESCFRDSYQESSPVVVIINSVHSFAFKRRQIFLYLLLDLIQRKDLLFTVSAIHLFNYCYTI